MSERASQMAALVGTIDPPASSTMTTSTTDVIDASLYDSVLFIAMIGHVSSSGAKAILNVYEGTATGTVTTKVGSQSWTASDTGVTGQIVFDLDCEDLSGPNHRYVKGTLVTSVHKQTYAVAALGMKPRFHPASDGDLATVTIKTST